jgi:rubrerythrin
MDIKGTKTESALQQLFTDKCIAHAHYLFYATEASRAGFEGIAAELRQAGEFELEHARRLGRVLHTLGNTPQNLRTAAEFQGERENKASAAEEQARSEGLDEVAQLLRELSKVARAKRRRFNRLAERIDGERIFQSQTRSHWQCRACGWFAEQEVAPSRCDLCGHPQAFFQAIDPDS